MSGMSGRRNSRRHSFQIRCPAQRSRNRRNGEWGGEQLLELAGISADWISDFDTHEFGMAEFRPGAYGKAVAKRRCVECWGSWSGRARAGEDRLAEVRCRTYDAVLEAEDANLVAGRMDKEEDYIRVLTSDSVTRRPPERRSTSPRRGTRACP